jgi:hypothetical protein
VACSFSSAAAVATARSSAAVTFACSTNPRATRSATAAVDCSTSARSAGSSSLTEASVTRTSCSATVRAAASATGFAACSVATRTFLAQLGTRRIEDRARGVFHRRASRIELLLRDAFRGRMHDREGFRELGFRGGDSLLAGHFGRIDRRLDQFARDLFGDADRGLLDVGAHRRLFFLDAGQRDANELFRDAPGRGLGDRLRRRFGRKPRPCPEDRHGASSRIRRDASSIVAFRGIDRLPGRRARPWS